MLILSAAKISETSKLKTIIGKGCLFAKQTESLLLNFKQMRLHKRELFIIFYNFVRHVLVP